MNQRGSPAGVCALAVACVLVAAAAGALDVELTYQTRPEENQGFFPYGSQSAKASLAPPDGDWKLPSALVGTPMYLTVALGERPHLLVLDKEDETDPFYNRLHFDANGNRDLTDDPVHTNKPSISGTRLSVRFYRINATVALQGKEWPYLFTAHFYAYQRDGGQGGPWQPDTGPFRAYINSDSAYHGTFALDGAAYDVWLGDGNANGRFDDLFEKADMGKGPINGVSDFLFLTGTPEQTGYSHSHVLGRHLVFGKKVFTVEIDTPGGVMRLTPVVEEPATLSFPKDLASLQMYEPDTGAVVTIIPDGKRAPLPPGKYQLLRYRLLRKEAKDAQWELAAAGTTEGPTVEAAAGDSAEVLLGEPFAPKITPSAPTGATQTRLSFAVYGCGEERVSNLRLVNGKSKVKLSSSDSNRPAEPTYRIVNAEGEVVASGRFEYG